jgi:hypothetical protein
MPDQTKIQSPDSEIVEAIREEILDEIADLEEYARQGKEPPHCRGYRYKVNGDPFVSDNSKIAGRQVLERANLLPVERYKLRVKIAGQPPRKVGLDEVVDLRHPGTEKFLAIPQDQDEG